MGRVKELFFWCHLKKKKEKEKKKKRKIFLNVKEEAFLKPVLSQYIRDNGERKRRGSDTAFFRERKWGLSFSYFFDSLCFVFIIKKKGFVFRLFFKNKMRVSKIISEGVIVTRFWGDVDALKQNDNYFIYV